MIFLSRCSLPSRPTTQVPTKGSLRGPCIRCGVITNDLLSTCTYALLSPGPSTRSDLGRSPWRRLGRRTGREGHRGDGTGGRGWVGGPDEVDEAVEGVPDRHRDGVEDVTAEHLRSEEEVSEEVEAVEDKGEPGNNPLSSLLPLKSRLLPSPKPPRPTKRKSTKEFYTPGVQYEESSRPTTTTPSSHRNSHLRISGKFWEKVFREGVLSEGPRGYLNQIPRSE